jgi:hypothetical protein
VYRPTPYNLGLPTHRDLLMNSSPRLESHPAMHPMPWRDANGRNLWRLVLCAAVATLILALACSLIS